MAEERVKQKELWQGLGKIKKQRDWLLAAERLGLKVDGGGGKGSHWAIRNGKYPNDNPKSLVATIQTNLFRQANQTIFKNLLDEGIAEDDIWRALKML